MNVQNDASYSHGVTIPHRSVLRKYNKYSVFRENSTEVNLQEMSVSKYMSIHELIRRSDMRVSWL